MSGQRAPLWPADKPLALRLEHFAPRNKEHPPQGTIVNGKPVPSLFKPVQLPVAKHLTLKNAVVVSPMCQYTVVDGFPTPYHLAHLGSFALHGAGTIIVEASGVTPQGRITSEDLGIYKDEHIPAHMSLVSSLKTMAKDLTVGIQIAHAGRKASTWSPFYEGPKKNDLYQTTEEGGWVDEVVGPSALAFGKGHITAKELSNKEVKEIQQAFADAANRAFEAGYDFVEVHAAHGYLLHNFLSPLSNIRTDEYGGSFENRTRLVRDIVTQIRKEHPDRSVWVRVSGSDYAEHAEKEFGRESWTIEGTKELAKQLHTLGVDVLDISGGGNVEQQKIKPVPGYQIPFAKQVSSLNLPSPFVATVGRMESGEHAGQLAQKAIDETDAKLVMIARGFLTKPSWVEEAAEQLTGSMTARNAQYHKSLAVHEVNHSNRN